MRMSDAGSLDSFAHDRAESPDMTTSDSSIHQWSARDMKRLSGLGSLPGHSASMLRQSVAESEDTDPAMTRLRERMITSVAYTPLIMELRWLRALGWLIALCTMHPDTTTVTPYTHQYTLSTNVLAHLPNPHSRCLPHSQASPPCCPGPHSPRPTHAAALLGECEQCNYCLNCTTMMSASPFPILIRGVCCATSDYCGWRDGICHNARSRRPVR